MSSQHRTPVQLEADKLAEEFGFTLAIACFDDESFGKSCMRGFTRLIGRDSNRSVDAIANMAAALQKIVDQRASIEASSTSTSHSTAQRKREGGKRSTAQRKTTKSRRVMPAKSAASSKQLRGKRARAR